MQQHKGQPCFINLWPDDVHTPWVPQPDDEAPRGPQSEVAFKNVLKEYDVQIGRLAEGLKRIGEDKNTIIIFTSDNGPLPSFRGSRAADLRGTKLSLYEGGIRMPFIVSWPGHIPAGRSDETSEVHATDLLPSLLHIAGIKVPADYQGDGKDRSGVFLGKPSERGKDMYWEYGRNDIAYKYPGAKDKSPSLAMRSGKWKLLMNADGSDVQLYNMDKDRNETTNVAASEVAVAAGLKSKLTEWWRGLPRLK